MTDQPLRWVVLLSGGLDSATVLAVARSPGFRPFALTFRYGRRHQAELAAFERLAHLATREAVEGRLRVAARAPLLHLTRAETVRTGPERGVDYSRTFSCYDPTEGGAACGECDAGQRRRAGVAASATPDPARDRDRPRGVA